MEKGIVSKSTDETRKSRQQVNRKAKLEKALAFERDKIAMVYDFSEDVPGVQAMAVSQKLAPLHEALIAAVEALEFYHDESYSLREGYVIAAKDGLCDYASGKTATDALSKIDKVLGEM